MVIKLKCEICEKVFYGRKNKIYCSENCKNTNRNIARRKKRNYKSPEEKRKEANKRYYLNTKYLKTKKYEKEQNRKEEIEKKRNEKRKEYDRSWKIKNKIKNAEYRRKTRVKVRGWFDDYKRKLKCDICGYNRCTEALDFHHIDLKEKEFSIGQALNRWGKEIILEEMKKCKILCANCHRELHYKEKQEKVKKKREAYLKVINQPKKIYYNIVEKELEKDWFKELKVKAKDNLTRFGGNQFIRVDNGIKEKIDIKKILAKKIGIGEKSICRIFQVHKRGTEEQKERVRTGESSINKVYKELEPIRYSKRKSILK